MDTTRGSGAGGGMSWETGMDTCTWLSMKQVTNEPLLCSAGNPTRRPAALLRCAQLCPALCHPTDCSPPSSSMWLSRQEYCRGLPCPTPGDLPNPGTEPVSLASHALADSSPLCNLGNPDTVLYDDLNGNGIQKKRGDICKRRAGSVGCIAETNGTR